MKLLHRTTLVIQICDEHQLASLALKKRVWFHFWDISKYGKNNSEMGNLCNIICSTLIWLVIFKSYFKSEYLKEGIIYARNFLHPDPPSPFCIV